MATKISKPVTSTLEISPERTRQPRECHVTIYPNGTIGFKEKNHRREYVYPLGFVWETAIKRGSRR